MPHKCENNQDQECECRGNCDEDKCECGDKCCGNGRHFNRLFQTKEEQIVELENYLKDLKLEGQAVEEHLSELRK